MFLRLFKYLFVFDVLSAFENNDKSCIDSHYCIVNKLPYFIKPMRLYRLLVIIFLASQCSLPLPFRLNLYPRCFLRKWEGQYLIDGFNCRNHFSGMWSYDKRRKTFVMLILLQSMQFSTDFITRFSQPWYIFFLSVGFSFCCVSPNTDTRLPSLVFLFSSSCPFHVPKAHI